MRRAKARKKKGFNIGESKRWDRRSAQAAETKVVLDFSFCWGGKSKEDTGTVP